VYHLIWKNYDGHFFDKFRDVPALAKKLLKLLGQDAASYGTEVIALTQGREANYNYEFDKINMMEKIRVDGHLVLSNSLPNPDNKKKEIICPMCGATSSPTGIISALVDEQYSTLERYEHNKRGLKCYKCNKCGKEFYL